MGGSDKQVPPETQMAAFNRITSKKKIYLAPEYGHEFIPRLGDEIRDFFFQIKCKRIHLMLQLNCNYR